MPSLIKAVKNKKEEKWLQEVYNDDQGWLAFDEWAELYEPPAKPKEPKQKPAFVEKRIEKKKTKAKENILEKLEIGISTKLVLLALEAMAKLMNQVEEKLRSPTTNASKDIVMLTLKLINSLSAVVLSKRFANANKHMSSKKAKYFEDTAIQHLADCLDGIVAHGSNQLAKVQLLLRTQFAPGNGLDKVQSFASEKLDDLLLVAEQKSDEKLFERQSKVDAKIRDSQEILTKFGIQPPKPPTEEIASKVKDRKDELRAMVASVIKQTVLQKLETLDAWISYYVDQLLVLFTLATAKASVAMAKKQEQDTHATIVKITQDIYENFELTIRAEVGKVLSMIGNLVEQPKSEGEDLSDDEVDSS